MPFIFLQIFIKYTLNGLTYTLNGYIIKTVKETEDTDMKAKIKIWKVDEITDKMCKYGDKFEIMVEGHEWGTDRNNYADENGFLTITNICEIVKETEKAICLNIDGFTTWCPKSAIIIL